MRQWILWEALTDISIDILGNMFGRYTIGTQPLYQSAIEWESIKDEMPE